MGRVTAKSIALHTAAATTANGYAVPCENIAGVGVQLVNTTGTFTITFEGSIDETNWTSVQMTNLADGSLSTTASAAGMFSRPVSDIAQFRARISAASSAGLTVTAYLADTYASLADIVASVTIGTGIAITQTPTVTAGGYTAADAVGGKLTFANAAASSGGSGIIQTVVITDLAKQDVALDLILFDTDFTATDDNAAMDIADAELPTVIGHIPISAADYCDCADNSFATVNNVGLGFKAAATSIYGQLVCRTAPTYASTSDVTVQLFIVRE